MGSRSDGWGESSCEWEDASAWLRSGGSTSGFSSRLAASEAPRSGGLADRTNAPSPAPREGRDALTPEQKARIAANREAALARKRRRLEDAARARAGDRGASRRLDATPAFREPRAGSRRPRPPPRRASRRRLGTARPRRTSRRAEDPAAPLRVVRRREEPSRRPRPRGGGRHSCVVVPRSPRPVPAPKPLAVALDAAFDGVARDDPRGPATDESTRRLDGSSRRRTTRAARARRSLAPPNSATSPRPRVSTPRRVAAKRKTSRRPRSSRGSSGRSRAA